LLFRDIPSAHLEAIAHDAMIEALTGQKLTDPEEWFIKIPGFLRAGTNPVEKSAISTAFAR
jgi:hypothetical protein